MGTRLGITEHKDMNLLANRDMEDPIGKPLSNVQDFYKGLLTGNSNVISLVKGGRND